MSSFDWSNPTVVRLLDRYTTLNRKATPQDAEQSRIVREVAEYYAANYEGTFEFMVSMHTAMDRWNKLTINQASGTINCLLAEYRKRLQSAQATFTYPNTEKLPNLPAEIAAHKAQEANSATKPAPQVSIRELPIRARCNACGEVSDVSYDTSLTAYCIDRKACEARRNAPVVPQCKNGTYTIVLNEQGDYRTIKLSDVPASYNKPEGTQIASYLSGSDNETNYTGFAFVSGSKFNVWKALTEKSATPLRKALTVLLSVDRETQIDMGHAYAIESGNCFICGRKLTVPTSLNRGMGPTCAEKY